MRLRLLPSHSFRHSRFTLAYRITSLLPTIRALQVGQSAMVITDSCGRTSRWSRLENHDLITNRDDTVHAKGRARE